MRLLDANLLIYAADAHSPQHARAQPWAESVIGGKETVALPWATILAFVRITTNPRIMAEAYSLDAAWDSVDGWLARANVVTPHPSHRHALLVRELLKPIGTGGNLVADAHLAALSIEYGAEVCSADNDFARFSGVRWFNPLRD